MTHHKAFRFVRSRPLAHENMVVPLRILVREAFLPVVRLSMVAHTLLSPSCRAVDALIP